MRLLAIETSGSRGGIALADGGHVIDEVLLTDGLRHARDLLPAIRAACERAGWPPRGIECLAISIGPGSFTGVRIAVTFAKFMAWDAGTRVVTVPSLRALAENAPPDRPRVVPVLDAKRGGLFASIFERRTGADAPLLARFNEPFGPALIEPADLAGRLQPPAYVLGHGITKAREALGGFELAPPKLWDIQPSVVAHLGCERAARGEWADPLRLEPVYLRPPDAEEIWQRRQRLGQATGSHP